MRRDLSREEVAIAALLSWAAIATFGWLVNAGERRALEGSLESAERREDRLNRTIKRLRSWPVPSLRGKPVSYILRTDGSETSVEPQNGSTFSLAELQAVAGDYVQMLSLPGGQYLFLNEEGKLHNLPRNERATLLGKSAGIMPDDYVVGDVLVADLCHLDFSG